MPFLRAAALLFLVGCSSGPRLPEPVEVKGRITHSGKPVDQAVVGFFAISEGIPAEKRYAQATTDANGTYVLRKVYPAEYMVSVTRENPAGAGPLDAAVPGDPAFAKYAGDSPLRAVVSGTKSHFDFDLTR